MKKHLLNLSMLALFISVTATVFAVHTEPIRTMVIPYADALVIDGDADAGYSDLQSTTAFNTTGSTGADADFTLTFKVAYDFEYLYFWGEVLDDTDNSPEYTTTGNIWTYDNIEVFVDLDTTGSGAAVAYDSNTVQLRFSRGLEDSVQTTGSRATQEEYQYYFANQAAGWIHEVAIPWKAVLAEGQVTEDILDYLNYTIAHGFDVSGADSDSDGPDARDCQTAWDDDNPAGEVEGSPAEDNAWNTRTRFGIITFGRNPLAIENPSVSSLNAYPNPATDQITFDLEGMSTVEIYSITGVQVMVVETTGTVDVSSLNSGMYVAKTANGNVVFSIR